MRVWIPKETIEGETRVAATPETVKRLLKEGFEVQVQSGAGEHAHITDERFAEAGAEVIGSPQAGQAWAQANIVLKVAPPTPQELAKASTDAVVVSFLFAHHNQAALSAAKDKGLTLLAMERVPRISRAQSMDALSSQASIGGYKAVLLAAAHLDKYFPLLMTAAGTVQPARVVVMGAGVAGLQAVATAKRLGAVVEVSDIRPAVKEQVESLGGRFIDVPMEESGEGEGGYAREVSKEFLEKQRAIVREKVIAADVVITTALVPGKPAPRLISAEMVQAMRPGAVIVDLAVEQGGNCELSERDRDVTKHDVLILGRSNLPASMPADASTLYARNVLALINHIAKNAQLNLDLEDEITRGTLATHQGQIMDPQLAQLMKGASS